jgi:hypothetical protein
MKPTLTLLTALLLAPLAGLAADESRHPDVLTIIPDLENPAITSGEPTPGMTVLQSLPAYAGTEVAHTLCLPADWAPGKRFPVIIEYLGNEGRVRDNKGIGYALSGGKGFIWAVLPFVSADGKRDMDMWWGDVNATVAYAKEAVSAICRQWGGDPAQVILVGYSRGAIACNYIGLHDDEIAKLWRAIIAVSHYDDGHTSWGMTKEEQHRAPERLRRLGKTPQYICGEYSSRSLRGSAGKLPKLIKEKNLTTVATAKAELGLEPITEIEGTRQFIAKHHPQGNFTLVNLPWVNHDTTVLHRNTPERQQMRDWLQQALRDTPAK